MPICLAVIACVLAHRQPGARLAVDGDLHAERRGQLAHQLEPVDVGLRPAQPEQHAAQVVAEGDRRVRGGVHAARDGRRRIGPAAIAVGGGDGRLQAGAARLLHVERRACTGDSALPSTHSRIRLKSRLCLSTAPPITAPSCSPARSNRSTRPSSAAVNMSWLEALRVGAVGTRERDPVAAEDGDGSAVLGGGHGVSYGR